MLLYLVWIKIYIVKCTLGFQAWPLHTALWLSWRNSWADYFSASDTFSILQQPELQMDERDEAAAPAEQVIILSLLFFLVVKSLSWMTLEIWCNGDLTCNSALSCGDATTSQGGASSITWAATQGFNCTFEVVNVILPSNYILTFDSAVQKWSGHRSQKFTV